jgi:hypothetical protein
MIQGDLPIWVHLGSYWLIWIGMLKVRCFKDRSRKELADWIISMTLVYLVGWCIGLSLNQ